MVMFNKNAFKEEFRLWSEQFPFASKKEIESFCYGLIPQEYKKSFAWLVEQSVAWYLWKQENLKREILKEAEYTRLAS